MNSMNPQTSRDSSVDPAFAASVEPASGKTASTTSDRVPRRRTPQLENVVEIICADARKKSLQYAIRSNVGHDGE